MTARRFTDKPELAPGAVYGLREGHPAMVENRTLFPSTVVDVDDKFEGRLLVSGRENRKLGERVAKGKFKGYALYGLSLEERATCPADCGARSFCYGNGMQMARRHRITDNEEFFARLESEIADLLPKPGSGLLVRLHVLGDFPSVEYVAFWSEMLSIYPGLACYGYTHRRTTKWDGDEIGDAIESVKDVHKDRFRIRWSSEIPRPDGAVIVDKVPQRHKIDEGLVCPAQTDDTACCASCGLCWEASAKHETIVFIKHGPKSLDAAATKAQAAQVDKAPAVSEMLPVAAPNTRPVVAIELPSNLKPAHIGPIVPKLRLIKPTDLRIEAVYQRDLSGKSVKLIRKIVAEWDWSKFKPPVCAETKDGLFVIDGQHTAIAAASHPWIREIPVMVVAAEKTEWRAAAFVSHNRDRINMTAAQIFYGDLAAKKPGTVIVMEAIKRAGADVPKLQIPRGYAKPGQISAIDAIRAVQTGRNAAQLDRILHIAVLSKAAPINLILVRTIEMIVSEPKYSLIAALPDARIAAGIASIPNIAEAAAHYAAESGQSRFRACAQLIARAVSPEKVTA